MKKIKDKEFQSWEGFQVENLKTLNSIRGGATSTSGGTYISRPGGGEFDDSREARKHENPQLQ